MLMASNKTKLTRAFLTVALAIALQLSAQAAPTRVETFTEALPKAQSAKQPLIVLIHGSSWQMASQRLQQQIWQNPSFIKRITSPVVMTHIHVRQNLDKPTAEQDKATRKDWQGKPVRTYPAIQIYGSDGHLLSTLQGRQLIHAASPEKLADQLNPLIQAAYLRDKLLPYYHASITAGKNSDALKALIQLNQLPINNETDILKMLAQADPNDSSGWQARLSFKGWGYMRDVTGKLKEGQAEQVLAGDVVGYGY